MMIQESNCIWIIISRQYFRSILNTSRSHCALRRSRSLQVLFSTLIKFRQCRISSNRSTTGHSWLSFSLRRLGSGWTSLLLFRSLLDSVHRQGQFNGRPSTTLWNIWKATLASRSHIGEAVFKRICCLVTQIRTGAIAHLDDRRPA